MVVCLCDGEGADGEYMLVDVIESLTVFKDETVNTEVVKGGGKASASVGARAGAGAAA